MVREEKGTSSYDRIDLLGFRLPNPQISYYNQVSFNNKFEVITMVLVLGRGEGRGQLQNRPQ